MSIRLTTEHTSKHKHTSVLPLLLPSCPYIGAACRQGYNESTARAQLHTARYSRGTQISWTTNILNFPIPIPIIPSAYPPRLPSPILVLTYVPYTPLVTIPSNLPHLPAHPLGLWRYMPIYSVLPYTHTPQPHLLVHPSLLPHQSSAHTAVMVTLPTDPVVNGQIRAAQLDRRSFHYPFETQDRATDTPLAPLLPPQTPPRQHRGVRVR